jgi:hypothetical protein
VQVNAPTFVSDAAVSAPPTEAVDAVTDAAARVLSNCSVSPLSVVLVSGPVETLALVMAPDTESWPDTVAEVAVKVAAVKADL